MNAKVANDKGTALEARLLDADGKQVAEGLTATIPNVKPWTAETPYLYILELQLKKGDEVLEAVRKQVGFRVILRSREGSCS